MKNKTIEEQLEIVSWAFRKLYRAANGMPCSVNEFVGIRSKDKVIWAMAQDICKDACDGKTWNIEEFKPWWYGVENEFEAEYGPQAEEDKDE